MRGDTPNVSRNAPATAAGSTTRLKSTNQHSRPDRRGELDREPRLADPARPRERHEPRARDGVGQPLEVVVPPEERVGRLGHVRRDLRRLGSRVRRQPRLDRRSCLRNRVRRPRAGDVPEHLRTALDELDTGSGHQFSHDRGHENLVRLGECEQPRRDGDAEPGDVVAAELDLARVERNADLHSEGGQVRPCRERSAQSASRGLEDCEYAVAGRLDPPAAPRGDRLAHDFVVAVQQHAPTGITHARVHRRRTDDVGEQRRRERHATRSRAPARARSRPRRERLRSKRGFLRHRSRARGRPRTAW